MTSAMAPSTLRERVRASFERSAGTYDNAAIVQRRVCDRLLEGLPKSTSGKRPVHILDAGCGTGYGSRLLRQFAPEATLFGLDFAPAMLRHARDVADSCCAADIENLPLADACVDLWWSSLTIQWCALEAVFGEALRVLRQGGTLALSTLGPATFAELRDAFAGVDPNRHTLAFSEPQTIGQALATAGFPAVEIRRERHVVHYPDLRTLLRSIKDIGAHNVGDGARSGMLGRHAWQQVEAAYEKYRTADGLPAVYDVIFAYAQK